MVYVQMNCKRDRKRE